MLHEALNEILAALVAGGVLGAAAARKLFNGNGAGKKPANGHASKADIDRLEKKLDDFIATQRERNLEFAKQGAAIAEVRVIAHNAQKSADQSHGRTDDILKTAATKK